MGVSWLAQVRFMHLAIFALAMIPLFLCFTYLSGSTLRSTPSSPIRSYVVSSPIDMNKNRNTNKSKTQNDDDNNNLVQGQVRNILVQYNNSNFVMTSSDIPIMIQSHTSHNIIQQNNTQIDLTKGVPAETIYEAGHVDVSSQICPDLGKHLKVLIAITSAPSHESARLAIRQTWGHFAIRKDVSIAFMLGAISSDIIRNKLDAEQQLYGDIIRGKFVDTYDNLTLKTISILEWVDNYCPKANFVLKTDDDMFINVSKLLSFIAKHKPDERVIYGRLAKKWKPIRNKKSKYYISPQQYKPAVFPDFTTGPAYLFPAKISKELYLAALNYTYFKLEDVFLTGIVANGLKIKRMHAPEFLNKRVSFTPCNIQREISIHMVKSSEQYDLWKKLHDVAKCKK